MVQVVDFVRTVNGSVMVMVKVTSVPRERGEVAAGNINYKLIGVERSKLIGVERSWSGALESRPLPRP